MAPPKVRSFKNSYAQTAADVDSSTLDSSLRSYMDQGDDMFKDETFDGKTRNEIIRQVRLNILRRMKEENQDSVRSANEQRALHNRYSVDIIAKINEAKKLKRDIKKNEAANMLLQGTSNVANQTAALQYLDELIRASQRDQDADREMLAQANEQHLDAEPMDEDMGQLEENDQQLEQNEVEEGNGNAQGNNGAIPEAGMEGNQEVNEEQQEIGHLPQERATRTEEVSQESIDQRASDIAYLQNIRQQIASTNVAHRGFFGKALRALSFVGLRSSYKQSKTRGLEQKEARMKAAAQAKADEWTRVREKYAETVYKKHYNNYDMMAKSWYEMTQEFSVGSDGEIPAELKENRSIPEDSAKAIVEYTGIYDNAALGTLLNGIEQNPYMSIAPERLPIRESKPTRGEDETGNRADTQNHTKTHRKIAMYSMAGEGGLKTRYKFGRDLMGKRSKRQFTAQSPTALQEVQNADEHFFDAVYAGRAGLESDETDIEGRKLFSEKNAEVLHAKMAKNKKQVFGFFLNGEFYTNEEAEEGERLAGRHDMKYFGRRSFTKQEKAEKLRVAIRKSAFFQHVNAATIQYYSSYNAQGDYLKEVNEEIDSKWEEMEEKNAQLTKENVARIIGRKPFKLQYVPQELQGSVAFEYIKAKLAVPGEKPFPANSPLEDPVLKWLAEHEGRAALLTCMTLLLAEDSGARYWRIARKMAVDGSGIVDARTKEMLKRLPEEGQMMRMGLLDELINHTGATSEFDLDSPLGFLKTPGLSVAQQELENKRGLGAWFKRNLLNGNLVKQAFSLVGFGFDVADLGSDIANKAKDSGWELDDDVKDRRDERKCWFLYGEAMAEGSALGGILGAGAVALGGLKGGMDGASKARDGYFQVADVLGMLGDLKVVVSGVWGAIKKFYKTFIKRKTEQEKREEAQEKAEALQDMDLGKLRAVLKFLTSMLNLADGIRDVASYHVDTNDEAGKWQDWGNLIAWKGPLQWVFDTARNLIAIVNDIAEIFVTTRRIGKIDKTDTELETAIESFNAHGNGENLAQQQLQPNEVGNQVQGEEDIEVVDPQQEMERKKVELGKAAAENSQAQYFMALTKAQSRKSRSAAGWDIASKSLVIARDTVKQFAKSGELISLIATAALTIAPKVVDFIGWTVGKLKYDRGNFKDNIAMMLGDKQYAKTPYFDKVLKREAGIVSSDYLVDVARIFTAIDTHVLLNKPQKSAGELDLAKKVAGTLYGNITENNMKKIELEKMLGYAGFSGDSDWRAVLRHAITG